jgi:hypothetical protein
MKKPVKTYEAKYDKKQLGAKEKENAKEIRKFYMCEYIDYYHR